MIVDMKAHRELQEQGIISIQQHPALPLLIHNYAQRCQWDRLWNDITLQCRGLITDLQGNVVCRPFRKFFNLGEHTDANSTLPPINWQQEFYVSEKLDGSLGIVYPTPNGYAVATRGSFISEQAIQATEMLQKLNQCFGGGYTYLFEILYPQNRIVLDYGDREELVLLDVIDNATGRGMDKFTLWAEASMIGCRVANYHHNLSADQLLEYSSDEANREGIVVRFEDGTRIKIKLAEYCRLHKLITGVNARHIWEYLRDGKSLDELIDRVPDEFMAWVNTTANGLYDAYAAIQQDAAAVLCEIEGVLGKASRKEYAMEFAKYPDIRALLFLMMDGQPVDQSIWKQLKPEGSACFAMAGE